MAHSGIRIDMDYILLAVNKYNLIKKAAAWFTLLDPNTKEPLVNDNGLPIKLNGLTRVFEYAQNNPDYFSRLVKVINQDIEGGLADDDEEGSEQ